MKEVIKRAVICVYCGKTWEYVEGKNPQNLWKLAIEHEKVCKKNPLVARINSLLGVLKFISQAPSSTPAKSITDYAREILRIDRIMYSMSSVKPSVFTIDKEPALDTSEKQTEKTTKALNKIAKNGRKEIKSAGDI